MFRQLIGLVLLSLAAFGITPAQADTAYLYQGAPKVEVFKIQQYAGTPSDKAGFDGLSSVDNLQPTISSAASRTYFTIRTQVLTNGPIDNIEVVAVCLYSQGNVSGSIDDATNCGYNTDDTTRANQIAPPTGYNPAHVISMAWTTNSAFRLDDASNNQHEVSGDLSRDGATESVSRTIAGQTVSLTAKRLDFTFALSHAAVNTTDWAVRVVALSTASPLNTESVDTEAFEHYYHGTCSNTYGDGQQLSSGNEGTPSTDCSGDPFDFGMNFFGGFMQSSVRGSYPYGAIAENGSSGLSDSLDTARYFANDTVSMTISASDFTFSDDTIPLSQDGGSVSGQKALRMVCNGQTDVSGSPTTNSVDVGTTINDFFTLMAASSDSGEASVAAPQHDCELFYGTGATYGDEIYSNSVTLGLYDAGASGPSATGLFQSVTTDSNSSNTFTVSSTDTAIRGQ